MNCLRMKLKKLEKQEQTKPKSSRLEETTKNQGRKSEIKTTTRTQKFNNYKSWFLEKISKIDRLSPINQKKKIYLANWR